MINFVNIAKEKDRRCCVVHIPVKYQGIHFCITWMTINNAAENNLKYFILSFILLQRVHISWNGHFARILTQLLCFPIRK